MMLPKFTTLEKWAASLIIDFPNDNIPILAAYKNWKEWGDALILENSFADNNAPGTFAYESQQKWMEDVFYAMANF